VVRYSMDFFGQLFEAVALLAPDFPTLGLVVPGVFSLYCIAKSLGLAGTIDVESVLRISLILGYFVTVTINITAAVMAPTRSRTAISSRSKPSVGLLESGCIRRLPQSQSVKNESVFIES
jgi:hypothetical protein